MNKYEIIEYRIVDISKIKSTCNYFKNKYLTRYNKNYRISIKDGKDKYTIKVLKKVIY